MTWHKDMSVKNGVQPMHRLTILTAHDEMVKQMTI